jgi:hypothetical protein
MIRPLRSRHRRLILIVAILVGVLSVLGLRSRRSVPTVDQLPGVVSSTSSSAGANE